VLEKTAWPADRIERRKTAELIPYANNVRTHTDLQIDQLANAITEWGWTVPVIVDEENNIIAGHGRIMAAGKLEIDEVPVIVAEGWSEEQKRAYLIADNRIAEMAAWDMGNLMSEAQYLMDNNFNLDLTGLDEIFLGGSDNFVPSVEPEFNAAQVTQAEIDKAKQKANSNGQHPGQEDPKTNMYTGMICPSCGEEFSVKL